MYSTRVELILGFAKCYIALADKVVNLKVPLEPNTNTYD
jgi:hypothetical protein